MGFRPSTEDDVKYAFAAYKMGLFEKIDPVFVPGLNKDDFLFLFGDHISDYDQLVTLEAKPPGREMMPVGYMALVKPIEGKDFHIIGEILWFPWASARNRIETAVNFFNEMKGEHKILEFAALEDVDFFVYMAKHGVMRRIGTSENFFEIDGEGKKAAVFETW